MERPSWHNVPSFRVTHMSIISTFKTRFVSIYYQARNDADDPTRCQAGTYWYHAHVSTQYCDGLRGPLVIYDPHDPHAHLYDVDDGQLLLSTTTSHDINATKYRVYRYDHCWLVRMWPVCGVQILTIICFRYHLPSPQVHPPPIANATLINGLGRYPGGPASPLAVVSVKKGKRYRFRLVSMACDSFFTFSIDGHNLTIIEADGVNTQPLVVDELVIFAAQRYSFILEAKETGGNFWIRAQQRNGTDGGPVGFAGGINLAILRYDGSPKVDPNTTQTPSVIPLVEADLRPLINPAAPGKPYPGGADINMNLVISSTPEHRFTINNASFTPPTVPTLLQILSGATTAQKLLPQGSVFTLPRNKVVELSIPSGFPVSIRLCMTTDTTDLRSYSMLSTSTEWAFRCIVMSMFLTYCPARFLRHPKCRHQRI